VFNPSLGRNDPSAQKSRSGPLLRKQPTTTDNGGALQRSASLPKTTGETETATCESQTLSPTLSPPGPAGATPGQPQWEEIKALRSMLSPEAAIPTIVEGCKRLCAIVDPPEAPLEVDPLSALWLSAVKRQQSLLRMLGRLANSPRGQHPEIVLKLCRLYLALKPGGVQLAAVAKTIYSQSKVKDNDLRFKGDGILPGMLRVIAQPQSHDFTTLLYILGALKHLSDSNIVRSELIALRIVPLFASLIHLESIEQLRAALRADATSVSKRDVEDPTHMGQLLVQVTAVLRNLAVNAHETKKAFVESKVIVSLCQLLPAYSKHSELAVNISRILSKLTLWCECLDSLAAYQDAVPALLQLLHDNSTTPALVANVCFVLGNITADNAAHRLKVLRLNAVQPLVDLLVRYIDLDNKALAVDVGVGPAASALSVQQQEASGVSPSDIEQVLIKLVRLLANLAISPELGPIIAGANGIESLLQLLTTKTPEQNEELVLNVVGAITNLSFYNDHGGHIAANQLEFATGLVPLLLNTNEEAVVASARAFGNFSRSEEVRRMMLSRRSVSLFISLYFLVSVMFFVHITQS